VLWLGDPEVLPVRGWRYDDQLAYGTSEVGLPEVSDRLVLPEAGATPLVPQALDAAGDRRTSRIGRLLAPMGVRYIVVQQQLAPSSTEVEAADGLVPVLDVLAQQLDLQEVPVAQGLSVYRNLSWAPTRSVLPDREGDRTDPLDAAADDLSTAEPALTRSSGAVGASGEVPSEGELLVSSTADDGWDLRIDGVAMRRSETYGWSNQFLATRAGEGELTYDTPVVHRTVAVVQAVGWVLALVVWRRLRRREA
jgi:hypothetical protein